jgi:spore coat protein U-like protein
MKFSLAMRSVLPATVLGFLALGVGSMPSVAVTATATNTFAVTATVVATCQVSATALGFGNYTGVVHPASSTVSVTCTDTTPYNVGLSAGLATGATVTARSMTGPASALLGYGLFQDAGHTLNWGQTAGTDTVAGIGNGAAQPITVYGQIPASEFVAPGAYADTITATVTY